MAEVTLPPFHPKAEEEMNAEADFYDEKHEDLGSDFLENGVKVIAVAYPSRKPGYWTDRL